MTHPTVSRMTDELTQIEGRIRRAMDFVVGEEFKAYAEIEQDLFRQQIRIMQEYRSVLTQRLPLAGARYDSGTNCP